MKKLNHVSDRMVIPPARFGVGPKMRLHHPLALIIQTRLQQHGRAVLRSFTIP